MNSRWISFAGGVVFAAGLLLFSGCKKDDNNPSNPSNQAPQIISLTASPSVVGVEGSSYLTCVATDGDDDYLSYAWETEQGAFSSPDTLATVTWTAPADTGSFLVAVSVNDGFDTVRDTIIVQVVSNDLPLPFNPDPPDGAAEVSVSANLSWSCFAPEGDTLSFKVYFGEITTPPLVAQNLRERNYDPGTLADSTTYYWRIGAIDSLGVETRGPVWSFTTTVPENQPPDYPSSPVPLDGAENIANSTVLEWSCEDVENDPLTYDVYLGLVSPPPLVSENQVATEYDPGGLLNDTLYYWRVVAKDDHQQQTEGAVWTFTTAPFGNQPPLPPTNPYPAVDSSGIWIHTVLSWDCEDPENDPLLFNVYLGTDPANLPQVSFQFDRSYTTDLLEFNTTYYWKIRARDSEDNEIIGDTWSFTTHDGQFQEQTFQLGNSGEEIVMIRVEPGSFTMGAPVEDSDSQGKERPEHLVTIPEEFWMAKFELTQTQVEAVADGWNPSEFIGPDRPVDGVSWNAAKSFIDGLNEQEDGSPWRLPTEAEWEYAARAGTTTRFSWGDDLDYGLVDEYGWYSFNAGGETHDVGLKLPNPWGFHDICGNVWEWCEDDWHENYQDAPNDGSAWIDDPRAEYRLARGGSWFTAASETRVTYRFRLGPTRTYNIMGIRLVRSGQ